MKTIRQEFRKSQFNFKHDKPHDFAIWSVSISLSSRLLLMTNSQFKRGFNCFSLKKWQVNRQKINGYFIFYRFVAAAFFLSVLVANGSISTTPKFFFIYLTNLGFIIQTLHLVVSLAIPIELILLQKANDETVGEKMKQIL